MLEMKFNIQMFAEGNAEGGGEAQQQSSPTETNGDKADSSTQESKSEVDIDSKITEAVNKMQQNWEAEWKKREIGLRKELERQTKEAERLAKLSDDERAKAELENSRKELEIKEKELQRKELMLEMTKVLDERGIPVSFMEYLIAEDSESTLKRITTFEKEYKAAIKSAVDERLKGTAPKAGTGSKNSADGNQSRAKGSFMKAILENQVKRG